MINETDREIIRLRAIEVALNSRIRELEEMVVRAKIVSERVAGSRPITLRDIYQPYNDAPGIRDN